MWWIHVENGKVESVMQAIWKHTLIHRVETHEDISIFIVLPGDKTLLEKIKKIEGVTYVDPENLA